MASILFAPSMHLHYIYIIPLYIHNTLVKTVSLEWQEKKSISNQYINITSLGLDYRQGIINKKYNYTPEYQ